mmetsp:Transcript_3274/g.6771  ORF Transcript_3274/g.6771 Transcript_3274/m.6771 type:complete len:204 (-) Transcript_3274:3049-3660(-)
MNTVPISSSLLTTTTSPEMSTRFPYRDVPANSVRTSFHSPFESLRSKITTFPAPLESNESPTTIVVPSIATSRPKNLAALVSGLRSSVSNAQSPVKSSLAYTKAWPGVASKELLDAPTTMISFDMPVAVPNRLLSLSCGSKSSVPVNDATKVHHEIPMAMLGLELGLKLGKPLGREVGPRAVGGGGGASSLFTSFLATQISRG